MLKLDPQLKTVDFQLALTLSKRIILSCTYLCIHSLFVSQYDRDFLEHERNTAEKAIINPTW